ncbi:MAG: SUMF1/EgtB/PvdO family nonheme iron enzyme, partial [Chloroflexota bacterium]
VADAVYDLFLGETGMQDNNLQFVRDMLTKRATNIQHVLRTYKDICLGKKVVDDERSISKAHLKISGVVRRDGGLLALRNRIYEQAFDLLWVKENTPPTTTHKLTVALSAVMLIVLLVAGYFVWREWNLTDQQRANRFEVAFRSANTPKERLRNLAGVFALPDFAESAINLFNSLPPEQQLELFEPSTSKATHKEQLIVALGIYQSLGFKTKADPEGDALLGKIRDALRDDENASETERSLKNEIAFWLEGRALMNQESEDAYPKAKITFENALRENPKNPALYFDLARAYIKLGRKDAYYYGLALEKLEIMLQLDSSRGSAANLLIGKDNAFFQYWIQNANVAVYPMLSANVSTPETIVDLYGVAMVLIPEGVFTMGSNLGEPDETPIHEVNLSTYYIDKYEVTNAAYKLCVEAGACRPPSHLGSFTRDSYYGNSQFDNFPVIYVDWNMAKVYCEWRGARLPTEAEWEKAARDNDGRTYPWSGDNFDCNLGNFEGSENGLCGGVPRDTTAVGSYPKGISLYGLYDMAGNVWEWMADWYGETFYSNSPISDPLGPESGQYRVLRGGAWYFDFANARSTNRFKSEPGLTDSNVGFRCARSVH